MTNLKNNFIKYKSLIFMGLHHIIGFHKILGKYLKYFYAFLISNIFEDIDMKVRKSCN